jgi:predicted ATPase
VRDAVTALDSALKRDVPALLAGLGILSEDHQWEQLDPPQRRERVLDALRRLVLRLAVERPVVLIIEDLHWIDDGTQEVLDGLVDAVPSSRILFLVNYRPEYQHAWAGKSFYRQIRLDPLSEEVSGGFLDALLGSAVTLVDLRQELVDRTQGNPFFLEESVQHLVETGVLGGTPGARCLLGITRRIDVPVTVQGVLASRIDRLSTEHKRLLQTAAVVGKDIPLRVLEKVAELQGGELHRAVSRLRGAELLREVRVFPDSIYTFKHALTHEVTYGTLLADRKQRLHAAVLQAMEHVYSAHPTEHVEKMAQHAVAGAVWDKGPLGDDGPVRATAMTQDLVQSARALNEGGRLGQALLTLGGCRYIEARYEEVQDCSRSYRAGSGPRSDGSLTGARRTRRGDRMSR